MDNIYKSFIFSKISEVSGILITSIHSSSVISYVEKLSGNLNISIEDYCKKLDTDRILLSDLINKATTNETYFFREEKQFDYLNDVVFPKYRNKQLVVWSAACSTGEEPLSLLALAMKFNINIELYASDIDDNVLEFFRKGIYPKFSFRNDGKKYHKYLENLGTYNCDNTYFTFNKNVLNRIKIFKYNLKSSLNFPSNIKFDIIFMRNVFIYFDFDTRKAITENIAGKLNDNGYLFYSVNEIGSMNEKNVPKCLSKQNYQQIYFFIKKENENNKYEKSIVKNEPVFINPCNVFYNIRNATLRKDFEGALKIVNEYKPSFADSHFQSFFKGYILMLKEDYANAEKYFITSEFMKNTFWPVYYFHGVLLEKVASREKAVFCFKKCLELMNIYYIDSINNDYNFLLKDVSPSIIYSYCSKAVKE